MQAGDHLDLDRPLIKLSQTGNDNWTVRNAFEGVQIFGGIGSGKTSGSGRMLALKYLSSGFGGLVLTVKPDERQMWEDYCRITNRAHDLVVISPGEKNHFNFLEYESSAKDSKKSTAGNILQVLKTVIKAREDKASGKGDDPFWESALDMLMSNIIDLCLIAYGKVSVQLLYDIAQSLPNKDRQNPDSEKTPTAFDKAFTKARLTVIARQEEFDQSLSATQASSFDEEDGGYEEALFEAVPDARSLKFIDQFFSESYMNLADRTRSVIDFSFSGFLFNLLRDPVYSLFCKHESNITPDDCLDGKIILIDLPVKLYHKAGSDSQVMFKYIWQRAMERRNVKENGRPVFLWADEAQNFLHEYDAEYQATARSSRIATVYISQNLPNYHANMGGSKSEFRVKSFLGTLATKIFHANADIETNRYASELIGDGLFEETSKTATAAGKFSASETKSVKVQRIVRPEEFVRLKTGGPLNDFLVAGYIHVQGNPVESGMNHLKIQFDQNYKPR